MVVSVWSILRGGVYKSDFTVRLASNKQILFQVPIFFVAKSSSIDATQEMLAVGASNILGSFFGSMPVTASFGR